MKNFYHRLKPNVFTSTRNVSSSYPKGCAPPGVPAFRFVPPKPVWRWHDDRTLSDDPTVFTIPLDEIPFQIDLDSQTLKLLERLSLVNFDTKKTEDIVEEAIRFADCLLTPTAFKGTSDSAAVSPDSIEEMYSLLESSQSVNQPLRNDLPSSTTNETADRIVEGAALTWENYFVAPPGNQPIHPKMSCRSELNEDKAEHD